MKKVFLLATVMLCSLSIKSQNYTPLVLDSLYSWSWYVDFETNDTIVSASWTGFSYNVVDSLIQSRFPAFRQNYSYGIDTKFLYVESLDSGGQWDAYSKSTTTFKDGREITKLNERYQNSNWENTALYTYSYGASGEDTLQLLQHSEDGMWIDFYKKEKTFDDNSRCVKEDEYYTDNNDAFVFSRGKIFSYDTANHLLEEIGVNTSVNGPYYTSKTRRTYNNHGLLDSITRCNFTYPNDGTCTNVSLTNYTYDDPQKIIANQYRWDDEQWIFTGKTLTFPGPEIYSDRPDSVLTYVFYPDSLKTIPFRQQFLHYEEIENDSIYFKMEEYTYFPYDQKWLLSKLQEEWYHLKQLVNAGELPNAEMQLSMYPNPCQAGQTLHMQNEIWQDQKPEVLVYDQNGRLISRQNLGPQSSFTAPNVSGIYTFLFRQDGRLMGTLKQMVIE